MLILTDCFAVLQYLDNIVINLQIYKTGEHFWYKIGKLRSLLLAN